MVLPEPVPAITNRVQTKNNSLSYIKRSRVISAHKLKTLSVGKCRYQMWILLYPPSLGTRQLLLSCHGILWRTCSKLRLWSHHLGEKTTCVYVNIQRADSESSSRYILGSKRRIGGCMSNGYIQRGRKRKDTKGFRC